MTASPAQQIREFTREQIARNISALTHLLEVNEPAIAVAEAQRRHTADVRDALKWVAAFSTAALLLTAQLFRSRAGGDLMPLSEGVGLAIGALAFLVSIVGAGLFLITVDLPMAEWLRLVVTQIYLDLGSYRQGMAANADADAALANQDDAAASAAIDRAQGFLDEVHARGPFVTPAQSIARLERLWLWVCLGGFALGLLAVLGDFIEKMPLVAR